VSELDFANLPAIGRITVSSPALMKCLESLNVGKPYSDQIKPYNFLQTCHTAPLGHPVGVDEERFHLVTPYDPDPRTWLGKDWIDQYTGKRFRVTTVGPCGSRQIARVKTYGDILTEYEFHPEAKCADSVGRPCEKQTLGLLKRRHVKIAQIRCIGKESNNLEDVGDGLVHAEQNVYTEYSDPRRDEWQTVILPAMREISLKLLVKESGMSSRELKYIRAGRSRPHRRNRELLSAIVRRLRPEILT
jgi:hypothetical protein